MAAGRVTHDEIVAYVGTRRRNTRILANVTQSMESLSRDVIIVTGCNRGGVDIHVRDESQRLGFRCIVIYARWTTHGKRAGPERNDLVSRIGQRVVAFPDDESTGTWDAVKKFHARGKKFTVVYPDGSIATEWSQLPEAVRGETSP